MDKHEKENERILDEIKRPKTIWSRLGSWLREWCIEVGPQVIKWVGVVILCIFGLYFLVDAVDTWNDYQKNRDKWGKIEHDHDTPVWIQGDWMMGEYRNCQMRTKTLPAAKGGKDNPDSPDKLPRLFCAAGDAKGLLDFQRVIDPALQDIQDPPSRSIFSVSVTDDDLGSNFHVLPVRYFGRIDRPDQLVISWRCQRKSDSLTCEQGSNGEF